MGFNFKYVYLAIVAAIAFNAGMIAGSIVYSIGYTSHLIAERCRCTAPAEAPRRTEALPSTSVSRAALPSKPHRRTFYSTGCTKMKMSRPDWNFAIQHKGQFICDNIAELDAPDAPHRGWSWHCR